MVLLLLIYCLMCFPLFEGVVSVFALLCVHFSFAIILKRNRKLVALLLLSNICIVTIYVLRLFLTVRGLVCSMSLWYFLIKLTYFLCFNTKRNLGRSFCTRKIYIPPPPCIRLLSILKQWFCCCGFIVYRCSHRLLEFCVLS